jgi:thiamine pyrophosphokinase
MNNTDNIVILANGLFPESRQAFDLLKSAEQLICCDGAADKLIAFGMTPHIIIGDMDSVSPGTREQYASIMIHSRSQETNDLTKAIHYCMKQGYSSVSILGATGLREDHTLGNISLLVEYSSHIDLRIISDFGIFSMVRTGEAVESYVGEKVSIFSIDNRTLVTSEGLKYPIKDMTLSNWYRATLNESVADRFSLQFDSDLPLIVYRAW